MMKKFIVSSLTAATMLMSTSALAMTDEQYNQFMTAVNQGNYATARNIIEPLAKQGDAEAQYNFGMMYEKGDGVAQDYRQAVAWYQKAANQGVTVAQRDLGLMYAEGRGVAQDYRQAVAWYQKAANRGDAVSQYNLGFMYANGRGVAQDFKQARYWFEKAAAQGNANAKIGLQQLNQMGK